MRVATHPAGYRVTQGGPGAASWIPGDAPFAARAPCEDGISVTARVLPTLLVIEDDELAAKALCLGLEASYQVTVAHDGHEGLTALSAGRFDAILLDLQMPVLDGHGFLAGRPAGTRAIPVIVMTASRDRARLAGVPGLHAVLTKPFRHAELLRTIEQALGLDAPAVRAAPP